MNYFSFFPFAWMKLELALTLTVIIFNYNNWNFPSSCCSQETCWYSVHDVCLYWPAWLCVIVLEAIWLCLTFLLPVPDCPTLVNSYSWYECIIFNSCLNVLPHVPCLITKGTCCRKYAFSDLLKLQDICINISKIYQKK